MKKIITWIMLVAMLLGMFAGCGQSPADPTQAATTAPVEVPDIPASTENNALDVINYLNAIYKDSGAKTSGDFERFGIVRIAGVPYTVEWTVDVPADKVTVDVHDDGTVTINVNEKCTEDTEYVLTATVTDSNGNTETASWKYLLPGVASVEQMQAIVDQAYSLEVGEAMAETVTLYGVITSIDTPYSEQYKNITVTIQIEGREDKPIMCYRLKGEGAAELNPGDTISVQGIIKNYNNKIEFDAGCTLNFVEKTGKAIEIPSDPHQILEDVYALGDNESLPYGPVTMTGRICSVDTPYSEQYKNITVTIIIDWYTVKCYRLKGEGAETLEMNDIITVKGYIKKYNGTREFDVPELLDVVKVGEYPQPADQMHVVKVAYDLDPGWTVPYGEVTLTGTITKVGTAWSDKYENITVTMAVDGDDVNNPKYPIICYRMVANTAAMEKAIKTLQVGDRITAKGILMKYQDTKAAEHLTDACKVELNVPELRAVTSYETVVMRAAAALEPNQTLSQHTLAGQHVLPGKVVSIDTPYNAATKKVTVTLKIEDAQGKPSLQCVDLTGVDADKIKKGDSIVVMGKVGQDAEGKVVLKNGTFIPAKLPNDDEKILDYAYSLQPGLALPGEASLTGQIISVDTEYSSQYKNITVTIQVGDNADRPVQCYRMKGTGAEKLGLGDVIKVTGILKNYNGKIEFDAGCTFKLVRDGDPSEVEPPASEDGATITFNDKSKRKELSTTKQVWQDNGVTVTNEKAASTTDIADYSNPARFYKGSSLTIEYPGMRQIVVNCDDYKDTYPTDLVNSISGATAVANGTVVTITFDAPVDSFKIPELKGQVRVDSITASTEVTTPETPDTPDTPDTPETGSVYMTTAPKNGDKVVIVAPAYNKALSSKATGNYNVGVNVTASGSTLTGYGDTEIWTVTVNEDGSYSFANGDQNIGMQASYTSMKMGAVNDDWSLTALGNGLFNIKNVVRGTYMEWYSKYSNWSTYGASNAATDDQFQLAFYLVEAAKEPSPYMTSAPATGDQVVIVAPAYNKALSSKATGNYNVGVSVTASGSTLTGYGDTEIWTVTVNADGSYTFANGTQNIGMQASYTSMKMGAVNDDWSLTALGDGLFNIKNVVRGTYMEWYSKYNNWSTYGASNAATDDQFQLAFHLVKAGGGSVTPPVTPDPDPEPPVTPSTPDIYASEAPKNGDKVVIVAPAYNKALSTVKTGNYNVGTDVSVSGDKLTGYADTEVFTVIVNDDGSYSFENGGKKLAMAASYSSMNMGEVNDKWSIVSLGNKLFNIKNNSRGNFMEWYSTYNNWSTYNSSSAATDDQYQLAFYVVESGSVTPDPEPPVVTPAVSTIDFSTTEQRSAQDDNQQVWTNGTVTLTNTKHESTQPIKDYSNPARFYAKTKTTIECAGMTKVVFVCPTKIYAGALTLRLDELGIGTSTTVQEGSNYVVTFELTSSVGSFSYVLAAQTRFRTLTVYSSSSQGGTTPEPELPVVDIAEALKAEVGTELKITGYVNMVDGSKIYVQDATGAVAVEMASASVKKGDTVTVTGTKAAGSVITGTAAELAESALKQFVTESPLYDVAIDVHQYHYMNITSNLTVIGEEGDYIIVADDEDNQIKIYDPVCADPAKLVEGAVITYKGVLTGEDAGYMVFKNTEASEINIVKEAPSEEPETPPAAPTVKYADFDTISTSGDSSYTKTYTTASGWTVKNSAIQVGGSAVANPAFPVIGADKSSKAPCLNGKVSAPGSITSPTLTGGISKLNINYTKMFTDTTLGATITITDLSTGTTYTDVLSKTADKNTKYEIWYYEWTLPTAITGDFTITIVNNSPTGNTGNKDRLTILDLFWTTP